jgi:hypothetical protein
LVGSTQLHGVLLLLDDAVAFFLAHVDVECCAI